jgi:two-component system response regulator AtoC
MPREPVKKRRVLVAGSNPAIQQDLTSLLFKWGYEPVLAGSVDASIAAVAHNRFVFTLLDLDLDGADGAELLRRLRTQSGSPGPIIALVNGKGVATASEAAALGVDDFLMKPVVPEELENAVKTVLGRARSGWGRADADESQTRLDEELDLWRSPRMQAVRQIIAQAARADVTVLVCGETGTGKDLVARAIHHLSARQHGPFVKVNCAAVPRELLESELFGHERGAFTGAHELKIGKFESANLGTIFLDEIGDLHPALQGKLLHVLQDGRFSRVGGRSTIKVDVRVLAATNQNLEQAVAAGRFREDLYYRLNVIQILVPPLRERLEEVPALAEYFVRRYARVFGREEFTLSPETLDRLLHHRYPGNVRELENMIKRMIVLDDPLLARSPMPRHPGGREDGETSLRPSVLSLKAIARRAAQAAEREAILRALEQTRWNRLQAARLLSISYRALLYKIKDADLGRERRPPQLA